MTDDADKRIALAFKLVYGRAPTAQQLTACKQHVAKMTAHHRQLKLQRIELPKVVVREMIAEQSGKLFKYQEKLLLSDFESDLKPWDASPETRGLAELCLVLLNSSEFLYAY